MSFIGILLLIVVSVLLSAMVAGYETLSTSHLRHWARQKDGAAQKLYPLKARGSATLLTIELVRALSLGAVVILIGVHLSSWLAWLAVSLLFFVAFVVFTQLYLKPFGIRLLVWCSAPLLNVTNFLKPITLPLGRVFDRFIENEPVTLTRSELTGLLKAVDPEDTDLTVDELRILANVLKFSHKTVHGVMIPKSKVTTVKVTETLSPIILDELYKSGHERFPVVAEDGKNVAGILNLHDLTDVKHHASVAETMQEKVYFVDEDRDLDDVLRVFYKTKQSVFVVHNQVSDMVGLISVEDIVQEILGKPTDKAHAEKEKDDSVNTAGDEAPPVVK
jgi:CBS domain containing-hemolysin-like protein